MQRLENVFGLITFYSFLGLVLKLLYVMLYKTLRLILINFYENKP